MNIVYLSQNALENQGLLCSSLLASSLNSLSRSSFADRSRTSDRTGVKGGVDPTGLISDGRIWGFENKKSMDSVGVAADGTGNEVASVVKGI